MLCAVRATTGVLDVLDCTVICKQAEWADAAARKFTGPGMVPPMALRRRGKNTTTIKGTKHQCRAYRSSCGALGTLGRLCIRSSTAFRRSCAHQTAPRLLGWQRVLVRAAKHHSRFGRRLLEVHRDACTGWQI